MKLVGGAVAALVLLGTTAARADEPSVRVIIAGPKKDPLAAKLEKEVTALGFTPVQTNALSCEKESVAAAAAQANAAAALCSDGRKVAVWTNDPDKEGALELRDTVAPDPAAPRDNVAMRAAEVMRANVEFREAEPPPPPAPKRLKPLVLGGWEDLDASDRASEPDRPQMTHTFTASFGPGLLIGSSTTATTLTGRVAYGIHRRFSLTARMDFPISESALETNATGSLLQMQTGLAGVGIEVPLFEPTSRVIPRFSVNGGAVWVRASRSTTGLFSETSTASATDFAASTWADIGLSVGLFGPIRVAGEVTFGTAFGRLTVLDANGNTDAHFGTPFGTLALRLEVALQ